MTLIEAVILDFIGTLISVKNYSLENSTLKLHKALVGTGFNVKQKDFLKAYDKSHEKYRLMRYEELIEVTNAVWISDALNCLGFKTDPEDARLKTAVNIFFEDYLNSLELNICSKELLNRASKYLKVGLISNFTYAPVIYAALRKLDINRFLNIVVVSEDVGWRKPNRKIFQKALNRLGVKPSEALYIGDSPVEDIAGAAAVGMTTVFVPSQFYNHKDLRKSRCNPDLIVKDMCELHRKMANYVKNMPQRSEKT